MIYQAIVTIEAIKCETRSKTKFYKAKYELDMVYTDGSEKKKDSYFIQCIEKYIGINFEKKESYKITNINKLKPIGLNG